jgi:arsenate reductase (thioredoxin)
MKILILCTGNSCRSQMAEGFLRSMDPRVEVFSAGTEPEKQVNKYAIRVMQEKGIDISSHSPKPVEQFTGDEFDYVITVCDDAREKCPYFTGKVNHRIHQDFEDPAKASGSEEEILGVYRRVRDAVESYLGKFLSAKR